MPRLFMVPCGRWLQPADLTWVTEEGVEDIVTLIVMLLQAFAQNKSFLGGSRWLGVDVERCTLRKVKGGGSAC
jgi:hypothetical protein